MKSDRIKNWPKEERPRERLLSEGADKLTEAELLAIILRVGQGAFKKGVRGAFAKMEPPLDSFDHSCGMVFVELFDGDKLRSDLGDHLITGLACS
jgi:hypothetical protein